LIIISEALQEHAIEPQLAQITEQLNANCHASMPSRRMGAIGAERPVPPGQIAVEV
jgi:hypothetical protein